MKTLVMNILQPKVLIKNVNINIIIPLSEKSIDKAQIMLYYSICSILKKNVEINFSYKVNFYIYSYINKVHITLFY